MTEGERNAAVLCHMLAQLNHNIGIAPGAVLELRIAWRDGNQIVRVDERTDVAIAV